MKNNSIVENLLEVDSFTLNMKYNIIINSTIQPKKCILIKDGITNYKILILKNSKNTVVENVAEIFKAEKI